MFSEFLLVIALLLLVLHFRKQRYFKAKNYPPGPGWKLPVIGHLAIVGENPHETLLRWKEFYGSLIAVQLGSFPSVFINDGKLIREAFSNNALSGRPPIKVFKDRSGGIAKGVLISDGNSWLELRRFLLRNLRDFGFGRESMETVVSREAAELVGKLQHQVGQDLSIANLFNAPVLNSLWCIITGKRFCQDDPELRKAMDLLIKTTQENVKTQGAAMLIPWVAEMFPNLSGYNELLKPILALTNFISTQLKHLEQTFEPGVQRGFVDVFLEESRRTTDPNSPFHRNNEELLYIMMDLFAAGTDTTSTALNWTFLFLSKYQDVQKNVHDEIDKVVGKEREPSLRDRDNMPFTHAVLHEVLRHASIVPLAIYHRALSDVTIDGYHIPKDTMVVPNLFAVHHDKAKWGDPENFRPERFLNKKGNFVKNEHFMGFSVGKRACLGESLARDEYFLFVAHLFQAFHVSVKGEVSLEGLGLVRAPQPHTYVLRNRNN